MKRSTWIPASIGVIIVAAVAIFLFRPAPEATAPISAIPLATQASASQTDVPEEATAASGKLVPTEAGSNTGDAPAAPAQAAPQPTAVQAAAVDTTLPDGVVVFTISQNESTVQFSIDEVLNNKPTTAVGETNQVAGEIGVDFQNPANSQVGIIQVNARTLQTDSDMRDGQIANNILQTGKYEFITFTPTSLSGMPAKVAVGDTFTFQLTGQLQIRDVSEEAVFNMEVTVVSADRLEGTGETIVLRSDYGINIPDVPRVANVSDEVILEFQITAIKK